MITQISPREFLDAASDEQKKLLVDFCTLLKEYNEMFNLTSITDEKEIFVKHFEDSSAFAPFFHKNASVCEVGSGGGFPSIPLKILRPDLSFTLFESVGKKCEFLRVAVQKLSLSNVVVRCMRAEDAGKGAYREKFDYCTARAVAKMNTLSEYCLPLVKVGGSFVAYKSGDTSEIVDAEVAFRTLGAKLDSIYRYSLSDGFGERSLAVVKKIKPTPPKYPRGQGKERKNPL